MFEPLSHGRAALAIVVLTILSACAAGRPPVIETLDERTGVSITYSRTPIIMSPDTPYDRESARDFVQIGVIEVNRMGSLDYYLWLGITDIGHMESANGHPSGFDSIVLNVDGEIVPLEVHGWAAAAINLSEPVYRKLYSTSADAYYPVTLGQIQLLTNVDSITLLTSDSAPREFVPWYQQSTAKDDITEFLRIVTQ